MASEDIASMLMRVAEVEESADNERPKRRYRSRSVPETPSQVYSIRLPREILGELRELANARGEAPTAMMREWVLERLREEQSAPAVKGVESPNVADAHVRAIRREKLRRRLNASLPIYSYTPSAATRAPDATVTVVYDTRQHRSIDRVAV